MMVQWTVIMTHQEGVEHDVNSTIGLIRLPTSVDICVHISSCQPLCCVKLDKMYNQSLKVE